MTPNFWLLILCCAVLAMAPLWYLYRANELGSRRIARISFWIALIFLGLASVVIALEYALPGVLMFFLAALYPLLHSLTNSKNGQKKEQRLFDKTGSASVFRSSWVEIKIDQDTGKFSGNVLQGKMKNWHLHEMDGYDLMHLRAEIATIDQLAVALLDIWLDHEGPAHWRRDFSNTMLTTPSVAINITNREEAASILGIATDADAEKITTAKTRLEAFIGKGGEHSTILDMVTNSAKLLSQ
jgi:hypothetical protein